MFRMACLFIGYCFGCIQTAFIVGKVYKKIDIRHFGSGNAGSTNVLRVMGKKAAAITFTVDILKTICACIVCVLLFEENKIIVGAYAGLGAILGHDFPFFLKFKGGKGIASTIGYTMFNGLAMMVATYPLAIVALTLTGYVSFASLMLILTIPITMFFLQYPKEAVAIGAIISAIGFIQHRSNIKRLLNKQESKMFSLFKPLNK